MDNIFRDMTWTMHSVTVIVLNGDGEEGDKLIRALL